MIIIITDKNLKAGKNDFVVPDNILDCRGCFGCWTINNYKCVLNDCIMDIGNKILLCDEIVIITKCINGSYSSKVKRVLERSIGFVEPYFVIRNNEIHHILRSDRKISCTIIVYNNVSINDKSTFEKLVRANNVNFASWQIKVIYAKDFEEAIKYL